MSIGLAIYNVAIISAFVTLILTGHPWWAFFSILWLAFPKKEKSTS